MVTAIGLVLLSIPLYDIWDDFRDLDWALLTTVVENAVFLLLALGVTLGGVWLVRSDWKPRHVRMVAAWTTGGLVAVVLLFGWVVSIQHVVMGRLKPFVIALNGVLIGTAVTFGLGLLSARFEIRGSKLQWEREAKASLESLHQVATSLQRTETPTEAFAAVFESSEQLLSPHTAQITIDGDVVAEETFGMGGGNVTAVSTATAPVGDRGKITLSGDGFEEYEVNTLWLLGTHLDRALERIDREQALADERNQLALINQTLRHELLNAVQIVQARLGIIENRCEPPEEHWTVVVNVTEKMAHFVQQMRRYTRLIERETHEFEPVDLPRILEAKVAAVQNTHTEAEVSLREVPDVEVLADELLGPLFENVLRNAVEHNDKETPVVQVSGDRENGMVQVEIADNGPGVPDEHVAALREGRDPTESARGGFGLHLVTEAIDSYGGDLQIEDTDPEGSVVRVTLPVA